MADAITAAPPDAAEGFLDEWHKTKTSTVHVHQKEAGPYKKIVLYDFKFLGRNFQSQSYKGYEGTDKNKKAVPGTEHTGAGVCAEFRDVLFNAQRLIFRSYAAEVRSKGETPSPEGFTKWCGVGVLSGWQFRSKQHSMGAAIDLDAKFNPYVPTGVQGTPEPGGEEHDKVGANTIVQIRRACLEAYKRAYEFYWGEEMPKEAMGHRPTDDTGVAYDHILKVHYAVVAYCHLGFVKTKDNRLGLVLDDKKKLTPQFGFSRPFGPESEPGSFLFTLNQYRPLFKGAPGDLKKRYDEIRNDYETLRLGMVYGKLLPATPGHMGLGVMWEEATRDPCYGFLTIRREIARALRAVGCRWGAIDFGPTRVNGDMMHFDKKSTIDQLAHTEDPNPKGLLYDR